jgi:signal transduction histidine kinase
VSDSGWCLEQLDSLHSISVEIASLRDLQGVYDRALAYCRELTRSEMGFIDLLFGDGQYMDVVAVQGFQPDPGFYERFRTMPVRDSVFAVTITEDRPYISNDVAHDPHRSGTPPGHPHIRAFLGVPLHLGRAVIGMIGVANRPGGYRPDDERLLSTFANQVAVAIENAKLHEDQQELITGLANLRERLTAADREQLVTRERERIAAGLHDHLEQSIFSIGLRLNALLEEGQLAPEVAEQVEAIRRLVSRTDDEVRDVVFSLAEGEDRGDLTARVRRLLRDTERTSGLETNLVVNGAPPRSARSGHGPADDAVYDVVKEAVTNIVKHAKARTALVSLRFTDDRVGVVVQDDGVGASELLLQDYDSSVLHYGLRHLREQVEARGGTFEVGNGDDGGLTIRAEVPVAAG